MLACCGKKPLTKTNEIEAFIKDFVDYIVLTNLDEECVICLTTIDVKQRVTLLKCGHSYHSHCIYSWFLKKRVCPLCNITIEII